MSLKTTLISICILSLITPMITFAAGLDLVTLSTDPKTPGPNQEVTVNIKSFAVNLNTAEIIWYVNKEAVKQGVADKSVVVLTGEFGTQVVVDVTIIPQFGDVLQKQIIIEPSEVDLLWEADTYTPPFYKGKALPTFKSSIKTTAMPRKNSFSSNPAQFYYKWTYNIIQNLGEALGMSSVTFPAGWPGSSVSISVDVNTLDKGWNGSQNIRIPSYDPKIVLYEQAPLMGTMFDKAIDSSYPFSGNTVAVRAVPYFVSTDNYHNNDLVYTWRVNNQQIPNNYEPTNIQLTKSGKDAETFGVSLQIQNPKRILQEGTINSRITLPKEE